MGKVYPGIDDDLATWLHAQPMWTVATAPRDPDGHLNVSPKGGAGTFRVLDAHRVAYVDLFGSGIETVAHLRDDGRIVLCFAAFDGRPRIVRLHGRGRTLTPLDAAFTELLARFPLDDEQRRAVRGVVEVSVTRVATSCGYVVPEMTLVRHRDQLYRSAEHKIGRDGPDAIERYVAERNAVSIDGLPGLGGG